MTRSSQLLVGSSFVALLLACGPRRASSEEATYELATTGAKATIGAPAKASVLITAKPGWHVNDQAPVSLKLTADPGLALDKAKLTRKDLAEQTPDRARFDVTFTATEPGKKSIAAEASFVMCQEATCKPVKEKVVLAVEVGPKK